MHDGVTSDRTPQPADTAATSDGAGTMEQLARRLRAGETIGADELEGLGFGSDTFSRQAIGLRWETFALDRVTASVECGEQHHQPYGIVHGGVWCAIVESLASIAGALHAAVSGDVVVGVSNATDFIRAHRTGRVDAVAEPIHVGRTQQLWQVAIRRASDGKVVARGQVRLQQLPGDRELAGKAANADA
jgi:1,4-dihydroxy-2-naphthoyl-CoA hydrolase